MTPPPPAMPKAESRLEVAGHHLGRRPNTFFSQTLDDISEKITRVFISTKVRIKSRISVQDIGAFFPLRGLELDTEVTWKGRKGRNRLVGGPHPVLVDRVQVGHELL